MSEFNKDEYRQRLIAHGIDPSSAAEVASKTAAARSMGQAAKPIGLAAEESSRIGGFQTVADPATVPEPETAAPQAATVASPAPSPTPFDEYWTRAYNNYKLDQAEEAARAGKTQPTRRERMASTSKKKPSTAVANLADQANQLEQAAVLKTTKAQIKKLQLSLFDLAPWADDMRAMPNDLARAALFTVRNKRIPRVARQAHSIFVLSKGVEITYTGIELRADDDELVWQQVRSMCRSDRPLRSRFTSCAKTLAGRSMAATTTRPRNACRGCKRRPCSSYPAGLGSWNRCR